MKIYPSITCLLDNGYRNSIVLGDLDFDGDWNSLKSCRVLLEDWADHINEEIASGNLPEKYNGGV
jgi:hypothetical protein